MKHLETSPSTKTLTTSSDWGNQKQKQSKYLLKQKTIETTLFILNHIFTIKLSLFMLCAHRKLNGYKLTNEKPRIYDTPTNMSYYN